MTFALRHWRVLYAPLVLFVLLALAWAGFGTQRVGLYEEWAIRYTTDETVPILINFDWNNIPGYSLEQHYTRPLSLLPNTVAFLLTPNSFVGHHLVLLLMLFGCGYFFYLLIRRLLPGRDEIALLAAILCMLPAADTGYMNFRLLVAVFVALCWVAATWLLVVFYQERRLPALVFMFIILSAGLMAYESLYPLVALTPLLLVWLARGINRRIVLCSMLWFIAPLIVLLRTAIVIASSNASYVGGLLNENIQRDLKTILTIIWYAFWRVVQRSFLTAWLEGLAQVIRSPYAVFAFAMAVVAAVALFRVIMRKQRENQQPTLEKITFWRWLSLLAISGGAIIAGFGLFLAVESYSVITDRVYVLTGFGTALTIALLVYLSSGWVARRTNTRFGAIDFAVVASLFVLSSAAQALEQTRVYGQLSLVLQRFLGQMAEIAPKFAENTRIMVIDESGSLNGEQFMGQEGYLTPFVRVLYQDRTLFASICSPLKQVGAPLGTCRFRQDTSGIEGSSAIDQFMNTYHPNGDLVLFRYGTNRNLTLLRAIPADLGEDIVNTSYQPEARILAAPPTARMREMFPCLPIEPCTESITPQPVDSFYTDYSFRDELLRNGLGWFKPETRVIGGATLAWNSAYRSVLNLRLRPGKYLLTARLLSSLLPDVTKGVSLTVNGAPVPLRWSQGADGTFTLQGTIEQAMIDPQHFDTQIQFEYTTLESINVNKPEFKGSVAFDYLKIEATN